MRAKNSKEGNSEPYEVKFTDKRVSGWGGMSLFFRYLSKSGAAELLGRVMPDGRTSPNQISVVDYVRALFAVILTGGSRFAHSERLRFDGAMAVITSAARIPTGMSLTRYFGNLRRAHVEVLSAGFGAFVRNILPVLEQGCTIDLDSTVFGRFGVQQGATKGYNPRRRGGMMQLPLLAMHAQAKMIVHGWLRAGNASPLRGSIEFFTEMLAHLGDHRVRLVRADSGFFSREFLSHLEGRGIHYAMAMKMSQPVQRFVKRIAEWRVIEPGLEISDVMYNPENWTSPRRLIVIREHKSRSKSRRSATLFALDDYTYRVIITSLDEPPIDVWREYNGRGDCENRIKELKLEFAADRFSLQSFDGTEAVFRLICFLFNLVQAFKRDIVDSPNKSLRTIRNRVFVAGCHAGASARTVVLRIGIRGLIREQFVRFWDRTNRTVMQLAQSIDIQALEPFPSWSLRYA